ncbi:MAG: NfeD family protein [Planctomycetaceae bacterium]|nr:NfeD family protein [Planctomycetaceae bacterium]
MVEFLYDCFQGPALVASTLVCCVMAYWAMVTLGAVDLDTFDIDLDFDLDADIDGPDVQVDGGHHSPLSVGMVGLKFFNLGEVPLMVWMTCFAICTWALTMLFDRGMSNADTIEGLKALARNGGIALFLAKFMTQPLKGFFVTPEINKSENLLGQTCIVTTSEVNSKHGQASYATEASPLVINVRTEDDQFVAQKGETVRIVDFEPERNTFIIQRVQQET